MHRQVPYKLFSTVLCMIVSCIYSFGITDFPFRHIGIDAGLSDRQVNHICRDNKGFLWISTPMGLDRYDGYKIKSFSSDTAVSLVNNEHFFISNIIDYNSDTLFTQVEHVFFVMNKRYEKTDFAQEYFKSLGAPDSIKHLVVDKRQNVWLTTRNRCFVSQNGGKVIEVLLPSNNGDVSAICKTVGGVAVLMEHGRIVRCQSPDGGSLRTPIAYSSPMLNGAKRMYCDSTGDIWAISCGGDSLWHCQQAGNGWSLYDSEKLMGSSDHLNLTDIVEDSERNIWLTSMGNGVFVIRRQTNSVVRLTANTDDNRFLRSNDCTCASTDAEGSVWIGYLSDGLSVYNPSAFKFSVVGNRHHQKVAEGGVKALTLDVDNRLWLSSGNTEVEVYDTDTYERMSILSLGTGDKWHIINMYSTTDGKIWVAHAGGSISIIDPSTFQIKQFPTGENWTQFCRPFAQDQSGIMWVATSKELQQRDATTGIMISSFRVPDKDISALHATRNSDILALTPRGVWRMKFSAGSLYSTHLSARGGNLTKYISEAYEDNRGLIWLGSRDGVDIIKIHDDEDASFINNIPLDGIVTSIMSDGMDDMIITTNKGVFHISTRSSDEGANDYQIRRFTSTDGLLSGEFGVRCAVRLPNGDVLLGNTHGLNIFSPHNIRYRGSAPSVTLCGIDQTELNNEDVSPLALPYAKELRIPYKYNTFAINFSALDFVSTTRVNYYYQLVGKGPVVNLGAQPVVHFSCLPIGEYKLRVWAAIGNGVSGEASEIDITVVPPVWRTPAFKYLLYLLVVALVCYVVYRLVDRIRQSGMKKMNEIAYRQSIRANLANVVARQASSTHGDMRMIENVFGKSDSKSKERDIELQEHTRIVCEFFENETINNIILTLRCQDGQINAHIRVAAYSETLIALLLHAYSTVSKRGAVEIILSLSDKPNSAQVRVLARTDNSSASPSAIGLGIAEKSAAELGGTLTLENTKNAVSEVLFVFPIRQ